MIKALYKREVHGSLSSQDKRKIGGTVEDKFFTLKKCSYTSVKLHEMETKSVFAVAFSHDGSLVASTHADHTIRVLFYEPFGLTHTLRGHVRSPISIQFHPKNRYVLASGCLAGQVFLWNLQSMVGTKMNQWCPLMQQPSHEVMHSVVHLPIGSIAFHPNGKNLVASRCRQLTMWNIDSPQPIQTVYTEHESERIRGVLYDPFGRFMITAIRRVLPVKESPVSTPQPEVKIESWSNKVQRAGRSNKFLREVMNNKIIGFKRYHPSSSSRQEEDDRQAGPSGFNSTRSAYKNQAGPIAGYHFPQRRTDDGAVTSRRPHNPPASNSRSSEDVSSENSQETDNLPQASSWLTEDLVSTNSLRNFDLSSSSSRRTGDQSSSLNSRRTEDLSSSSLNSRRDEDASSSSSRRTEDLSLSGLRRTHDLPGSSSRRTEAVAIPIFSTNTRHSSVTSPTDDRTNISSTHIFHRHNSGGGSSNRGNHGNHSNHTNHSTNQRQRENAIEREVHNNWDGLQHRPLCTNCQAGAFSKHYIQKWEYVADRLPNIKNSGHKVITDSAIMVTNLNFQVSSDGQFVCVVEKEDSTERGVTRGAFLYISVYSLNSETFKQCLMKTNVFYIPMCISITPFNKYIVAFARPSDMRDYHAGMIITYEVPNKVFSDKQRLTRSMTKPPSSEPKFNKISIHDASPINIARFGLLPWQGTVIGTCTGNLYQMRIDPKQIPE